MRFSNRLPHQHFARIASRPVVFLAALAVLSCLAFVLVHPLRAQDAGAKPPANTVFVKTKMGGFILGYDIDQAGTEGLLAESVSLANGHDNPAIETFDQSTGQILDVVSSQMNTKNDFVTLGIYGNSAGLVEYEKVKHLFVSSRLYATLNPLDSNMLTGRWTPPLTTDDIIIALGASQGAPNTAVFASQSFNSIVFSTNVAANTFGPVFTLSDSIFDFNNSPVFAVNTQLNQGVVAASLGSRTSVPELATVDLATGSMHEFTGLGLGFVNGIAVDSATDTACTTTEIDFSIEFYNLATGTGFIVPLQGATGQLQSGGAVAFDPIHKLFLIGQEYSSVAQTGSSIQVYDEQGHFVEAVNGLSLPASPAYMALNPALRTGFVIVAPSLTELQSFTY